MVEPTSGVIKLTGWTALFALASGDDVVADELCVGLENGFCCGAHDANKIMIAVLKVNINDKRFTVKPPWLRQNQYCNRVHYID